MQIIQLMNEDFLHFTEKIFLLLDKSLGDGFDFYGFEEGLKAELRNLGCIILKRVLEALDQYYLEHPLEREGWKVLRGPEPKTILTTLGEVVYRRRYYRHQQTKKYRHIVDYISGIGAYERVAPSLKATLAARAAEMSYRKAAEGTPVTKQTVHNILKNLSLEDEEIKREPSEKKEVKTIYVEADEDHVALQNGKRIILPLIYVHEGWQEDNGRRILINPFYISGLEAPEDLWFLISDYIYNHYDFDKIEQIFIGGDGASWIRNAVTIIPKSKYVLDRFHLVKYLRKASLGNNDVFNSVLELVKDCDWDRLHTVLTALIESADDEKDRKKVKECLRYVKNNWDGIEVYKQYADKLYGISAEAHVSHVLADRISSRPKGWSNGCLGIIARLRAMLANGVNLKRYIAKQLTPKEATKVEKKEHRLYKEPNKQRGVKAKYENYFRATMPALASPASRLTKTLRSIAVPEAI